MKKLILNPTDISQWYALVNEAEAAAQLALSENTESYLVFLLKRFSQTTHLLESVVALDLLNAMHSIGSRHVEMLRDVGDKSLLLCGLFPGVADKRHVKLEYYSEMGKAAYLTAGELQANKSADLYFQLSQQFLNMQQVLQAMRNDFALLENKSAEIINFTGHTLN